MLECHMSFSSYVDTVDLVYLVNFETLNLN